MTSRLQGATGHLGLVIVVAILVVGGLSLRATGISPTGASTNNPTTSSGDTAVASMHGTPAEPASDSPAPEGSPALTEPPATDVASTTPSAAPTAVPTPARTAKPTPRPTATLLCDPTHPCGATAAPGPTQAPWSISVTAVSSVYVGTSGPFQWHMHVTGPNPLCYGCNGYDVTCYSEWGNAYAYDPTHYIPATDGADTADQTLTQNQVTFPTDGTATWRIYCRTPEGLQYTERSDTGTVHLLAATPEPSP